MNRAVALRIAACGIMGLGAALLIAALLLSTYTHGKIAKIPLNLDATLISDGTGTAFDPASLNGEKFVIDRECAAGSAGADHRGVAVQRGRRDASGRQHAAPHRQATGQRVCCSRWSTPSPSTARRRPRCPARAIPAAPCRSRAPSTTTEPPTNIALPHDGLTYRFPFDTEKKTYPVFDPIAQKAFDANYDGEEDVNGLTTYRFSQNVGYDSDGKLVEPVKYSSLLDDDADAEVTARAALWGVPGEPDEPITMTRYLRRTAHVLGGSGVGHHRQERGARLPLLRA